MKTIVVNSFVSAGNPKEFSDYLTSVIKDIQSKGIEVEVQYSTIGEANNPLYTALVIGRQ